MKLGQIRDAWKRFFFTPQPATVVALLRILMGLSVLKWAILIFPDIPSWYGPNAVLSVETARDLSPPPNINPLSYAPFINDASIYVFFTVFCIAAVAMSLGLCTRIATLLVWLGVVSFHTRDPAILNAGDLLLRLVCFYLVLSPCGECFSLDRLIRVWLSPDADRQSKRLFAPWVQRLLQLQMAFAYFGASVSKLAGPVWIDGSAVYYVLHQNDLVRYQLPFVSTTPILWRLLTWYTLVAETSMWTLVWVRELRYPVLIAVMILHIGIDYSMVLPVFETLFIATLIIFVYPEDLTKCMDWLKSRLNHGVSSMEVIFDGDNLQSCRIAETLRRLDILSRLQMVDCTIEQPFTGKETFDAAMAKGAISVFHNNGWLVGWKSLACLLSHMTVFPSRPFRKEALSLVIIVYCGCAFLMSCPPRWTWAKSLFQPFDSVCKYIGSYYALNLFTPNPARNFVRWEFEVVMNDGTTTIWRWPKDDAQLLDRKLYARYLEVLMRFTERPEMASSVGAFVARQCDSQQRHPVAVRFIRLSKHTHPPEFASAPRAETRTVTYTYHVQTEPAK
jgi:hypothetical protein